MAETTSGRVKFFNSDRGYGFIKAEDGREFFYHITDLEDQNYRPQPDDRVRFDVGVGKRGPKATNIKHAH